MSAAPSVTYRAAIHERAADLADADTEQEEIAATLQREFPGFARDAFYLNPAAIAVMRRIRREQQQAQGRLEDMARLRAKGLPVEWALRPVAAAARQAPNSHFTAQDEY